MGGGEGAIVVDWKTKLDSGPCMVMRAFCSTFLWFTAAAASACNARDICRVWSSSSREPGEVWDWRVVIAGG